MEFQLIVLVAVAALVVFLIWTLLRIRRADYSLLANHMAKRSRASLEVLRPCPLCQGMLKRGETVHSVVYGKNGEDRISHIFGCKYCYPANPRHRRVCPVCRAELSSEGYLIARMFERRVPSGSGTARSGDVRFRDRTHVHVLGCTECRVSRSRAGGVSHFGPA